MKKNACDYYYLGDYQSALECSNDRKNAPYIIAAAVFRGDHKTARRLYKESKSSLNQKELIFTNFHLGVSYTRTSNYLEAEKFFIDNWKERNKKKVTGIDRFYIYRGLSFFRFFFSKHESSLYFANIAEAELLKEESPPALLVALVNDLIAHNHFQLGRPAKGQIFLSKAIKTAKENHLMTLENEFRASSAIFKSQYSLEVSKNIKKLKSLLKKTPESNDYTCSELILQISKLYLLKGAYSEANNYLIKNFKVIYENDNKRKVAKLNTLLAQLLLPKRQYIEALSLLKVAKSNLSDEVDFNLLAPILGIENQVLKFLGQSVIDENTRLKRLLEQTDKGILKQINLRSSGAPIFNEEDQLGVLFDKAFLKDDSCLDDIISNELFHLSGFFLGPFEKKRSIVAHPRNKGIFFFSEDEISFQEGKVSKIQTKFLSLLSVRPRTKEELVKEVWGYSEYDPFRHDHLVYTLVRRTRSFFGMKKTWIQSSEDLYFFDSEVQFILNTKSGENKKSISVYKENALDLHEDINFRQIKILDGALKDGFSANEVADFFDTTRMTSYRDLDYLLKKGLLIKRGNGRGTRYFLN